MYSGTEVYEVAALFAGFLDFLRCGTVCVDWIGKQMQVVEYVAVYLNRQIARTVKGECECVARYGRLYAVRERAYPYIIHFFCCWL